MTNSIRSRREALGISQVELAKKSRVSRQTIIALESGKRTNVKAETLLRIASALKCAVADIFF